MAQETVLKHIRETLGLSQMDLANKIGRTQAEISLLERSLQDLERYPELAKALSETLHIPEEDLQLPYISYVLNREVAQQTIDR